jgi:hypothetical protein
MPDQSISPPNLDEINAARKASGNAPLTPDQAHQILSNGAPSPQPDQNVQTTGLGGSQPPQQLGIVGSSLSGPLQLTQDMGKHADWDKFESEARPSTNVEDDRNRPKSLKEKYNNAIDSATDDVTTALFK